MSVTPMTMFLRGRPQMVPYDVGSGSANPGDVVVVGSVPMVAHEGVPSFTGGKTLGNLAVFGGIYQMQCEDVGGIVVGTYVHWDPTAQQVTATPTGSTSPFGWIVGGPADRADDGGPTTTGSLCSVLHDPTAVLSTIGTTFTFTATPGPIVGANPSPSTTGTGGAVSVTGGIGGSASGAGGAVSLVGGVGTAGNAAGGASSVTGGAGQGSAAGGATAVTGGAGGATGAGGASSLVGGAGGATSGTGGAVAVTGGAGTNGNAAGGTAAVTGGAGQGTGAGGASSITGGASGAGATGNGGLAKIVGGAATSTNGTGGAAQVTGGLATGTGTGGAVTITGGASGGAGGTSGAVAIDTGAVAGGTGAAIGLGAANATAVNVGATGNPIKLVVAGTLTAGGLLTAALQVCTSGPLIYSGSGAPTLSAAVKGSLYLRSDGSSTSTRAYIATDTAGTWTAITTAA